MNDDTISRQAAIDAMELLIKDLRKDAVDIMNFGHNYNHGVADAIATLKHLPSAERRGRWIYDEWKGWCCSECGNQAPFWCLASTQNLTDYCPNCGAKMEAKENEND